MNPYLIMSIVFLLAGIVVMGTARLLCTAFSKKVRKQVTKHPMLHLFWFLLCIVILVMAFVPFISTHHPVPKSFQTKYYNRAIASASEAFLNEYGNLPLQTNITDHPYLYEHEKLISTLLGKSIAFNPRSIVFIEIDGQFVDENKLVFIDAWDKKLNIIGDWSMDKKISIGTNVVNEYMAVWSNGENGINEFGEGDDINSWSD